MCKLMLRAAAICFVLIATSSQAKMLISDEEAGLPGYQGTEGIRTRAVTRGPRIEILAPNMNSSAKPIIGKPVVINVKFEALDGADVSMDSLKVVYLKLFGIDITDRLKPYVKGNTIDVDEADIPYGDHSIRVDIRDSRGRTSSETFSFIVQK